MQKAANDNRMTDATADRPEPRLKPCPICGRPASVDTRPFCSKRCADIDLHRWLGGRYAIPSAKPDDDDASADREP